MAILSEFSKLPIINRIAKLYDSYIGANEGQIAPKGRPKANAESHPLVGSADPSPLLHQLNANYVRPQDNVRKRIALDILIASNPSIKTALKNFAYDAAGTFQSIRVVSAVNKDKTQKVLDDFTKRVRLKKYLAEYFRRALLYGEEYLQHEISRISSSQACIKQLFYMPIYGMIRCSNELDQFDDPNHAYEQQDVSMGVWRKNNAAGIFPSWAINNIRMFNLPGEPNGFSLFEGNLSSGVNDRLVDLYVELYWQRKYSTVTDIFSLTGPEGRPAHDDALNAFMDKISKMRRMLFGKAPAKDIAMPNGSATRLQSDANTDKIKDIQLQSALALVEAHQSPQMLYDDEFANVGVLVEKFRQYNNRQESHLVMFTEELDESVQLELALHGIDPTEVELEYQIAQQYLLQDAISINQEARNDRDKGYITEETKVKIGSQLYRIKAETELEKLAKEKEAKRITDQNNSDENKQLVDKTLSKTEIGKREVTIKEVDPEEIDTQTIN